MPTIIWNNCFINTVFGRTIKFLEYQIEMANHWPDLEISIIINFFIVGCMEILHLTCLNLFQCIAFISNSLQGSSSRPQSISLAGNGLYLTYKIPQSTFLFSFLLIFCYFLIPFSCCLCLMYLFYFPFGVLVKDPLHFHHMSPSLPQAGLLILLSPSLVHNESAQDDQVSLFVRTLGTNEEALGIR